MCGGVGEEGEEVGRRDGERGRLNLLTSANLLHTGIEGPSSDAPMPNNRQVRAIE